jgi:hypothetical protein
MKCIQGSKLFVDSFFVALVLHVTLFISIVIFRCDFRLANLILRDNNFSIATWS